MFRFTIRDVLWLTVVVGILVGWAIEHGRTAGQLEELAKYRQQETARKQDEAKWRELAEKMYATSGGNNELEWEKAKEKSRDLGAPQPATIP